MNAPTILIVEDDAIIARHLQFVLRKLGYAVDCIVTTGAEAVEKSSELLPDLIMMDIHLTGDMDGVEAAEEIRKHHKIPIIYLTAYAGDDLLRRARMTAPAGYILKPFEERHLHATIEMALEKQQLENQLQEKNDRYTAVMAQLTDGFLLIDPTNHQIIEVNPAFTRMMGKAADDLIGKRIERVMGLNTHQFWNTVKTRSLENQTWHREYRYIRKDGTYLDLDVNLNKVDIQNQDFLCGVVRDITDHRAAQESLQKMQADQDSMVKKRTSELEAEKTQLEKLVEGRKLELEQINSQLAHENLERRLVEEKYRNIVENAAVGIFQATLDGKFISANLALAHLFGYENPAELMKSVTDIGQQLYVNPEQREKNIEIVKKTRGFVELETAYKCKHGNEILGLLHYRAVRDDKGNILYLEGFVYDISQRKSSETLLRQSEEQYRTIYHQSPALLFSLDPQLSITSVNDYCLKTLGYTRDEVIGHTFIDFLTRDSRRIFKNEEPAFKKSGSCKDLPLEFLTVDGEVIDGLLYAGSERSDDGQILSIMASLTDVTRLKRDEDQLERQLQRQVSLHAAQLSITSGMDFTSALNSLLDYVSSQLSIDAAALLILDESRQVLEYGAVRGFRPPVKKKIYLRHGNGFASQVFQERRMVSTVTPDQALDIYPDEHFTSYIGVPLMINGEVRGVLEVLHRSALSPSPDWIEYLNAFASQIAIALENISVLYKLQTTNRKLIDAYDATILGWSRTLEKRDLETEGHSQRVAQLALDIARQLGVTDFEGLYRGSLLHDVGKFSIPDSILNKPTQLTQEEWDIVRRHPVYAFELLSPVEFLRSALDIPYCHHERWDGSGYPRGLKGEQIPLSARIFAVVDVWDSLTQKRPYRPAWSPEKARDYIKQNSGILFDSRVVDAFFRMEE